MNDKSVIKYYILGYLNVYNVNYYGLLGKSGMTYKEFKLSKIASYLSLSLKETTFLKRILTIVIWIELPISFLIVSLRFIHSYVLCLFASKRNFKNEKLLLGAGEMKTKQVLASTDYEDTEIIVVKIPYISQAIYSGLKTVSVFSGISTSDVIRAYWFSLQTIFIIYKKYHKRDFLTRSYSSFEFYLAFFYTERSSKTNVFLFTSTYSKWAIFHGHLKHKTVFLQHGWLSNINPGIIKAGRVDAAYYISEQQKGVCEKLLFYNKPEAHYLKGIEFNIKPDNKKVNILLICEAGFRNKELKIIDDISQNKDLRLFVKPHPKDKDIEVFETMKLTKGFTLLSGYNFPEVNYVISYESTLAVEYEMKGIETLIYESADFDEKYASLINMKVHDRSI